MNLTIEYPTDNLNTQEKETIEPEETLKSLFLKWLKVRFSDRLALRPEEAARFIGLSRAELYRLIQAGEIVALKSGRATIIPRTSLEQWLNLLAQRSGVTL